MTLVVWIGVGIVGALGAIMRFVVDGRVAAASGRSFPFGTLVINLTGSLVLGVLVGAGVDANAYLLAGTATIGSYTTFSTWMYETQRLVEDGQLRAAARNLTLSLVLGFGAALLGRLVGGHL